jgi:hypothetical protein
MKKIIKTIRTWFVIAYANYHYKKNVRTADKLNRKHHTRFYVALNGNKKSLFILSRKGFRHLKNELSPTSKDSVLKLKEGSYYYTGNAIGADTMPPLEKEARRLAFIKLILEKSHKREG